MAAPVRPGVPAATSGLSSDPAVLAQQIELLRLQKEVLELQNAQRQQQESETQVKQAPSGTDKTNLLRMQLDDLAGRERMLDSQISSAQNTLRNTERELAVHPQRSVRIHDSWHPNVAHLYTDIDRTTKEIQSLQADKAALKVQRRSLEAQIQALCSPQSAICEELPRETSSARRRRLAEEAQIQADNQRAQQEVQETERKAREEWRARQNQAARNNPYRTGNMG